MLIDSIKERLVSLSLPLFSCTSQIISQSFYEFRNLDTGMNHYVCDECPFSLSYDFFSTFLALVVALSSGKFSQPKAHHYSSPSKIYL
jgi:hypothetical protein